MYLKYRRLNRVNISGILHTLIMFIYFLLFSTLLQAATVVDKNGAISLNTLEQQKKAVESDNNLDEITKNKVLAIYSQAIESLEETYSIREQTETLRISIATAPARIKEIRKHLSTTQKNLETNWDQYSIEQVEQQLKQLELELQQSKRELKNKEEQLSQILTDSKNLTEKIAINNRILQEINQELQNLDDDEAIIQKARQIALDTRKALRMAEIEYWKLRFSEQDLLVNLMQSERNLYVEQISTKQRRLDSLRLVTQARREQNAQAARQEAEQFKKQSVKLPIELQQLADDITVYRIELESLLKQEQNTTAEFIMTQKSLENIKSDFERIQQRVKLLGAVDSVNKLLRKRKQDLPSQFTYHQMTKERQKQLAQITDRQLEIDDMQRNLVDTKTLTEQFMETMVQKFQDDRLVYFEQQLVQLIQAKRDALNELQKVYGRYASKLSSLDSTQRESLEIATAQKQYIDAQLLWIPNTHWRQLLQVQLIWPGLTWMTNQDNLFQAMSSMLKVFKERTFITFLVLLAGILLLYTRTKLITRLQSIGMLTRKIRTDSFLLTLEVLLITLLLAMPWALLFLYLGWSLQLLNSNQIYTNALASGFMFVGQVVLLLSLIRQICRKSGLAEYHLRWLQTTRINIRKELTWLLLTLIPLGFIATFGNHADTPESVQLISRYAYLMVSLLVLITIFRLFQSNSSLILNIAENKPDSGVIRFRLVWYPILVIIIISLLIADIMGYHYTAWQIQQQMQFTLWLLIALWFGRDLLLRWLYIAQRRLRFEEAVRRREELKAQRESGSESEIDISLSEEVEEINYNELSDQAKRLLHAGVLFGFIIGVWLIWHEWLPSINLFFQTELPFETTKTIDGVSKSIPLTIADFIIALLILSITILIGKNLPGVVEIILLQHLPLEHGTRYAITALSQYSIIGIGIIATFSHIGMEWSNLQWLVAALGVGVGFGLQEIVANFISGIILLFESPIRAGDLVTVGGVTGRVSKINIRATTIINFDKQELIVPNKEFITGNVLNWTLTNTLNRVIIEVGIAYNSDVDKAMTLLTEAAQEGSKVLDDPAPVVSFDNFGDSALLLKARCYLASVEDRLSTITEVNRSVMHKFREAGIEIAFPQQDTHLDSREPLAIRIVKGTPDAGIK